MLRNSKELIFAFLACILVTASYAVMLRVTRQIPAAGGLYGHVIGILGFVLMLATETLYSLRKRNRTARWGRMSSWLQFHIFTGIAYAARRASISSASGEKKHLPNQGRQV